MGIVDHAQDLTIDFGWEKVFDALSLALPNVAGMKVDTQSKLTKTFTAKMGVSLFSWGENVTIALEPLTENRTKISILSTPKTGAMFGGVADMGKNRKNINAIMAALEKQL